MPLQSGLSLVNANLKEVTVLKSTNEVNQLNKLDFNAKLEDEIVLSLVSDKDVIDMNEETTNDVYTNDKTDNQFSSINFSDNLNNMFEFKLPIGSTDRNFAVLSTYIKQELNEDTYTENIGTTDHPINKTIDLDTPDSFSLFNSNLKFNIVPNTNFCFDDSSINGDALNGTNYPTALNSRFKAKFNSNDSQVNLHRILNSEFSTTDNSRPMYVQEYTNYNTNYSMGQDETIYITLDENGMPIVSNLNDANIFTTNGFVNSSSVLENVDSTMFGTYKIEQSENVSQAKSFNGANDTTTSSGVSKFPIYDYFNNSNLSLDIGIDKFYSIFNLDGNLILSDYKFAIKVDNTANSGFAFDENMTSININSSVDDTNSIITIDDSALVDNKTYMEDLVNGTHNIEFQPATLNIVSSTNGDTTNIEHYFNLDTLVETLGSTYAGQDGEIKLNKRSVSTRVNIATNCSPALSVDVYYQGEDNTKQNISTSLATNSYVAYKAQLVMKNTQYTVGDFIKETINNSTLNLFDTSSSSTSICNSDFKSGLFNLTSLNQPNNNPIELFKITPNKQLANVDDFKDSTGADVQGISAVVSLTNLKTLYTDETPLDSSKILFSLKKLNESTIYSSIYNSGASGWMISTENTNGFMNSSSDSAFAADGSSTWPTLVQTKDIITNNTNMNFTMSFGTEQGEVMHDLQDFITITYTIGSSTSTTIIPQEHLTKIPDAYDTEVLSTINGSGLTLSGPLVGKTVSLNNIKSTRTFKYSYDLSLRGFTGLTVTTPMINAVTTYYQVIDGITGKPYPKSYLNYINNGLYISVTEVLSLNNSESNSSSVSGTLSRNDLCNLLATVHAYETNDTTDVVISDTVNVSPFYSIPVTLSLLMNYKDDTSVSGEISLLLETDYINGAGDEVDISLTDSYSIQLSKTATATYAVKYFTSSIANLSSFSNISDDTSKLLSVSDNYANIIESNWSSSSHRIVVTHEDPNSGDNNDNSTLVLTILRNTDDVAVYTIKTLGYSFPIVQMNISRVDNDVWRSVKTIGNSVSDSTTTETFVNIDYANNVFMQDSGVYITRAGLDASTITTVGDIIEYSLLPDQLSVNLVGSASNSLSNISYISSSNNGLSFQYVDGSKKSRTLTIERYRGYSGAQTVTHSYTIERDQLQAIFTATNGVKTASQTFDVYAGQTVTVDSLSNGYGNIGLKFTFPNISMFDQSESGLDSSNKKILYMYTKGDTVTVTITNPNLISTTGSDATPIVSTKSLKNFSLYTFSGSNFNNTDEPLQITSSRLKLQSSVYSSSDTSYSWEVSMTVGDVKLYKVNSYTGNPADVSDWGTAISTTSYDDLINTSAKLEIGSYIFKRNRNFVVDKLSTTYLSFTPPFMKFVQNAYNDTSITIPYNPTNFTGMVTNSYLPVNDTGVYNPFTSYSDVNDVTFTSITSKSYSDYSNDDDNTFFKFVVEGNILTIEYNIGLKTSSSLLTTIFGPSPANRLLDLTTDVTTDIVTNDVTNTVINPFILLKSDSDNYYESKGINGAITLAISQTSQTFDVKSPDESVSPNITFSFGSVFFQTTNSVNLSSGTTEGQELKLFTRQTYVNNSTGEVSFKVYKYAPLSLFKGVATSASRVVSIPYNTRKYKTFTAPAIEAITEEDTTSVPNWETIISEAFTLEDVTDAEWIDDEEYNNAETFLVINMISFNDNAIPDAFSRFIDTRINGYSRAAYVTRNPIIHVVNTIRQPVFSVAYDGLVTASSLATGIVSLNPYSNGDVSNTLNNFAKFGILGHKL
jgi:hypothetical protein